MKKIKGRNSTPQRRSPTTRQAKLISVGDTFNCPMCGGAGEIECPPYYSTPMPPPEKIKCGECSGQGSFLVIPDYPVLTVRLSIARGLSPKRNKQPRAVEKTKNK